MKFFSIKQISYEISEVSRRFPLIVTLCILETVLSMIGLQSEIIDKPYFVNLLASIWLTILGAGAVSFGRIGHDLNKRLCLLLNSLVVVSGVILYLMLPDKWLYPLPYQYALFSLAGWLLILIVGFGFKQENRDLTEFYLVLIQRVIVTALFSVILYGGLAGAVWSFCTLLGFEHHYKVYSHLAAMTFGLFSPFFLLSGIPRSFTGQNLEYPRLLKVLLQYLLLPIVAVYLLILYIYLTKILFTASWPKGMVSELILSYAAIGMAVFFLLNPLSSFAENSWIRRCSNYFYLSMLPLLVMLFLAVFRRITDYGLTTDRCLVVLLAIWFSLITIYMLLSKQKNLKAVLSLFLLCTLVFTAGPFNAFSLTTQSQLKRLERILATNHLWHNNKLTKADKPLTFKDNKSISSILDHFQNTTGLKIVQPYFLFKSADTVSVNKLMEQLNLRYISYWENEDSKNGYTSYISSKNSIIDIAEYNYLAEINRYSTDTLMVGKEQIRVLITEKNHLLLLQIMQNNQELAVYNLNQTLKSLSSTNQNNVLTPEKLTFDLENKQIKCRLVVQSTDFNQSKAGQKEINSFIAKLFFTIKQ